MGVNFSDWYIAYGAAKNENDNVIFELGPFEPYELVSGFEEVEYESCGE